LVADINDPVKVDQNAFDHFAFSAAAPCVTIMAALGLDKSESLLVDPAFGACSGDTSPATRSLQAASECPRRCDSKERHSNPDKSCGAKVKREHMMSAMRSPGQQVHDEPRMQICHAI